MVYGAADDKQLDPDLECTNVKMKDNQIIMKIRFVKKGAECPYCGYSSSRIHSTYEREIQDIPTQGRQMILLVTARKLFCINPSCTHKTFSDRFNFVMPNGRKTKRLVEQVLVTSTKLSSISSSTLLRQNSIKVCKSSICDLIKKMPAAVDKCSVKKVCIDDFALRKKYTYGTVMVDLEPHRIIDLIDLRETKAVEEWLKTYRTLR